MFRVGFTGNHNIGFTDKQEKIFKDIILEFANEKDQIEFHHGDCIGADAEAHDIVQAYNTLFWKTKIPKTKKQIFPRIIIEIHPPINPKARAFKQGDLTHSEKEYIQRNHDIVDTSDILIAIPSGYIEKKRSGTWATIRYAIQQGVPIWIIYPDGNIERK
jgi:hypothetical protein